MNGGWAALPLLVVNGVSTATVLIRHITGRLPAISVLAARPFWLVVFNAITGLLGYLRIGHLLAYAVHDARDFGVRRAGLVAGLVITIPLLCPVSQVL